MNRIGFITGSRADYGIMRKYLSLMNNDPTIELGIIATGALLDDKFGHQVDLIYKDGYCVDAEIKTIIDSSSNKRVIDNMSETLSKFGEYFSENKYDMVIILGDRYEMLSVAIAASMQRVPILHIHGGEATFGNYDEFIRHAITKMSLYHFTATEEYRNRVIQLGEQPRNVFYLGALGAENCLYIDEKNVTQDIMSLPYKKYFTILFHPETLTNIDTLEQIKELIKAVDHFPNFHFVFLGTNADTNSDIIRSTIKNYVAKNDNTIYYENLHSDAYHYLLKNGICLIGNSSSGIIEAPSLGIYTVNIGNRQKGRVRGNSVIDTICNENSIVASINNVLSNYENIKPINPYYKEKSASLYYSTTKILIERLKEDVSEPKIFYDLSF